MGEQTVPLEWSPRAKETLEGYMVRSVRIAHASHICFKFPLHKSTMQRNADVASYSFLRLNIPTRIRAVRKC